MKIRPVPALAAILLALALTAGAITHFPKDVKCPLCNEKNTFYDYGSWGGYVYQWPSKFQFVFWPYTDGTSLYHCKKCHFTAYLWDFEKPPQEKLEATRQLLQSVAVSEEHLRIDTAKPEAAAAKEKSEDARYVKLPMSDRLELARKIYELWGRDTEWWCHFHRVMGYHLELEKKSADAVAARRKALALVQQLLSTKELEGRRKELLLISGAMRHFLNEDEAALADLNAAAALTNQDAKWNEEQNKNFDGYLSALLQEYIAAIKTGKSTADPGGT